MRKDALQGRQRFASQVRSVMAADDQKESEELQRRQALEEIRRRAEEAELKRIEELEKQAEASGPPAFPPPVAAPGETSDKVTIEELRRQAENAELKRIEHEERKFRLGVAAPLPGKPEPRPVPPSPAEEPRLVELREKLSVALDRGRLEKASDIFAEFSGLNPPETELEEFQSRLNVLEAEHLRAKKKKHAFEARASAEREVNQQKINTLLEVANVYYQQEKYEKGLECIDELLALEETNEDALLLRVQIQKAKKLAEQIKEEDAHRKAAEAAAPAARPEITPAAHPSSADVWGAPTSSYGDASYGIPDLTQNPAPQHSFVVRLADRLSRVRVPRKILVVLAVVAAVVLAAYLINTLRKEAFIKENSLLVLPAEAVDADSSSRFLAEGITYDLIEDFAVVSDLRLIGPVTALSLGGGDAALAARRLSANYFLQWKIARSSDAVALELALFDTLSTESLWRSRMQRSYQDLAAVRQEITQGVLGAMKLGLTQEDHPHESGGTQNLAAYVAYARGRDMLAHSNRFSAGYAVGAFTMALALDSHFQDARSALAWTHVLMFEASADSSTAPLDTAWVYSQDAVQGGHKTSEVYRVMGMVEQFRGNYERAVGHLEQAVAAAPNDAESQRRLAELYVIRGRADEGLKAAQKAASCDPRNIAALTTLALIQQFQADFSAAARTYEQASQLASDPIEYESGYYSDVLIYLQQHDRAAQILQDKINKDPESITDYYKLGRLFQSAGKSRQQWADMLERARDLLDARIARKPDDAIALSLLSLVRYRIGRYDEAVSAKTRAIELAPRNPEVLMNIARMHALHRDKTEALEYLRLALDRRYRVADVLDMDFFNVRSDPDFLSTITR
jgi:tetratricopeptide (TPR) repeat protein